MTSILIVKLLFGHSFSLPLKLFQNPINFVSALQGSHYATEVCLVLHHSFINKNGAKMWLFG